MKKNKGFTLIELLAVIVILAIVAIIATPIILNTVNDAKKSAAKSEARMIVSGINNYCATEDMKKQLDPTAATNYCGSTTLTKTQLAVMVDLGTADVTAVTLASGKVTAISVNSNGYGVSYGSSTWGTPTATFTGSLAA